MDDIALLQEYARSGRESAFATLVQRHIGLVYSAARRQVGDSQHAEDVTQAVFVVLARKAGQVAGHPALSGWLLQTTRYAANAHIRAAARRAQREQEAAMQSDPNDSTTASWEQLEPHLDEALASLGTTDRAVLALRFFENKTAAEAGRALNLNEEAAKKRTHRALEKLRKFFAHRGVALTAAAIAGATAANSVQAAPAALAKSVTAVALTKGATAGGSTLTLIKGALKIMAWTKMKTAAITGATILLATGTTTLIATKGIPFSTSSQYEAIFKHPDASSMKALEATGPVLIIRPTRYPDKGSGIWTTSAKGVFVGGSLSDLFGWAYGIDPVRVILPDGLPTGNFDYLNTMPDPNDALRRQLDKQFGVAARREPRPMDVLILRPKDPARLNSFLTKGGQFACYGTGRGNMQSRCFTNSPLMYFAEQDIQGYFQKPCLVRTDPKAKYDFAYQWEEPKGLSGDARKLALRPVIEEQINQLGLELAPSRESIEMLVVEKAR